MKKIFLLIALAFTMSACTDAGCSRVAALGDAATIEMINCDGTVTKKFRSTGKVSSSQQSDGYYFRDKATGKLTEVSGNVVITYD